MESRNFPLVTIVTLIYNTGNYVVEALQSVKNQNYPNIQHVLIDDFSADDSIEVVEKWIKENNYKCHFIQHLVNQGICKSLNEGLKITKGKYVTFISDDLFCENKLFNQVQLFENLNEDFGVVYSDAILIEESGDNNGTLFQRYKNFEIGPSGNIFEELFKGNFIHGTAALIRKSVFDRVGLFNEELFVEDIDMYLRIAERYKFYYSSEISAKYRVHSNSLLNNIGIYGLECNIQSLLPFYEYNEATKSHFLNYFDSCLIKFYSNNYINWRIWFRYRLKVKKDIKSICLYGLATLNINSKILNKLKNINVENIFKLLHKIKNKISTKEPILFEKSYSQCGEDLIIKYVFNLRKVYNPSYLDIGANNPFHLSNTALFYNAKNIGVNIEANPNLINAFKTQRPTDINLNIGIGLSKEELDFYVMEDHTLSSFSRAEADSMVAYGHILSKIIKVQLIPIEDIFLKYFPNEAPDLLSIDVEGLDLEILKSIDYKKYSPKIICVEAAEYSPIGAGKRRNELIDFLVSQGYYEYANTNLNAIMILKDFWFI